MFFHTDTTPRTTHSVQPAFAPAAGFRQAWALTEADRDEVLRFLAARPVHTVVMAGFINDNGIVSSLNRGTFFGYRNEQGVLEGVSLIGHATLIEARSEEAIKAFAQEAKRSKTPIRLILSNNREAETFWHYFGDGLHQPRLSCTELLYEVSYPFPVLPCEWNIVHATAAELEQVAEAQAAIAVMESGIDPMAVDREGFLKRVMRRIEQNRVFVVVENGKVIFKADIIAQTDQAAYLEGIYIAPEYRGRGMGSSCLNRLTIDLLKRVQNVCFLSNISFIEAQLSYLKAGFTNSDSCTTLFV